MRAMREDQGKARRAQAYQRLFSASYKRLLKQGVAEREAGQIARKVAEESLNRATAPNFRTEAEFAEAVRQVCEKLAQGMSHYELIEDVPYLVVGRLDRLVRVAQRVNPPVERKLWRAAKKAIQFEKMSSTFSVLFMALALGTLGLWYAIAVGFAVAVAAEIYLQTRMPASLRRAIADHWVPYIVAVVAGCAFVGFAYLWILHIGPRALWVLVALLAQAVITVVVPGLTLAQLVSWRGRKWRLAREKELVEKRAGRRGKTDE